MKQTHYHYLQQGNDLHIMNIKYQINSILSNNLTKNLLKIQLNSIKTY